MTDAVSPLLQWLHAHPHLAGLVTFIISAGESVAIIGTIVPGSIMMTALGTLAGAGVIPLWSTIIWAILGAIVGDGISYWMGHYFKDRLPLIWPFRNYPGFLKNGEKFFYKYGAMSVFIGRFVGPVRALVPMVAGMMGMRPLVFTIANIASAIGWAPAYMLPGILLGAASLELPPDIAIHVMLVVLLMTLFVMLCLWFIYKILQLVHSQITQLENKIWRSLEKSRYFHQTTVILKHYDHEQTHGQFTLAIFLFIIVVAFIALAAYVKVNGPNTILINEIVYHLFRGLSHRSIHFDQFMVHVTMLGQKEILFPALFCIGVWLYLVKHKRAAVHVFAFAVLIAGSVYVIKHTLKIARPWGILYNPETYSMPSGHTTIATAFYFGIALLLSISIQSRGYRKLLYWCTVIFVFAIGVSRLYLGAHWFTDVIAGWLLAAGLLIFIAISYQRKYEKTINPIGLLTVTILSIAIGYAIFSHFKFDKLMASYQQKQWASSSLVMEEWWKKNGFLPAYRTSVFGVPSDQINIQWVGNINQIRNSLLHDGWNKPPARDFVSTLHRIADVSSTRYLPLISPQYLDRKPELILTRIDSKGTQLVIRLWNSYRTIEETGETLWVGVIGTIPPSYGWLFNKRPAPLTIDFRLLFPRNYTVSVWQWKLVMLDFRRRHRTRHQIILLIRPTTTS